MTEKSEHVALNWQQTSNNKLWWRYLVRSVLFSVGVSSAVSGVSFVGAQFAAKNARQCDDKISYRGRAAGIKCS
jgi:hypothetical protein